MPPQAQHRCVTQAFTPPPIAGSISAVVASSRSSHHRMPPFSRTIATAMPALRRASRAHRSSAPGPTNRSNGHATGFAARLPLTQSSGARGETYEDPTSTSELCRLVPSSCHREHLRCERSVAQSVGLAEWLLECRRIGTWLWRAMDATRWSVSDGYRSHDPPRQDSSL